MKRHLVQSFISTVWATQRFKSFFCPKSIGKKMKFYIGSDHAGFRTKETLKKRLAGMKVRIVDMGAFDEERSDYPDFAKKVSQAVVNDKGSFGLLVCGTGIGMCIAANKVRGV